MDRLDPLKIPDWDSLVLNTPGTGFFHSSAWCRVLAESYGYRPVYFAEIAGDRFKTLVPFMEVDSSLTGKRGVSLPFTDYCQPAVNGARPFQDTFREIAEYGRNAHWRTIGIRSGKAFPEEVPISCFFYGHILDLTAGEENVLARFRDSTRRNIARALREGVEVKISRSFTSVREFYRLNCLTRRDHGLPPQPFAFFEKVFSHVIAPEKGLVVLAEHSGKNIAGAIFFHFGNKSVFKYGASDSQHLALRPNNLVMWEAMKWYCNNGYRSFSFGRTDPDNGGLLQFKRGWGSTKHRIDYYTYDTRNNVFMKDPWELTNLQNKIFKATPMPLLRLIGSKLYRHVG